MSEWVNVKDRLPELDTEGFDEGGGISDPVLILYTCKDDDTKCIYRRVGHLYRCEEENIWTLSECLTWDILPEDHENNLEVTHWMLLPEPPK